MHFLEEDMALLSFLPRCLLNGALLAETHISCSRLTGKFKKQTQPAEAFIQI